MRSEAKLLKGKAIASLLLAIDHFNGVNDTGRADAVLIFADHSFEMLLKAAIIHRGGSIREPGQGNTIGFDACVRRGLSSEYRFLTATQALTLQTINGLRDAAQHHLLVISEPQLYYHAQSAVTLFRDLLQSVFGENLKDILPARALPIATVAVTDPLAMFNDELDEVRKLLAPGQRKGVEAQSRLRGIAIVNKALEGSTDQPSVNELKGLSKKLSNGETLTSLFPGIGGVNFSTSGSGAEVSLRITKKEGVPVTLVPEGTPGASVVAIKRVDELGFYNLGHRELSQKVGLTTNKTTAAVALLKLKSDPDCFKDVTIGAMHHGRYSQTAVIRIKDLLKSKSVDDIWAEYRLHAN